MSCSIYPPLIPFVTIGSILMSVNSPNFASTFFKTAFHSNPRGEKKLHVLTDKFLNLFIQGFQEHLPKLMYDF